MMMKTSCSWRCVGRIIAVLIAAVAVPALAYVPPANAVLKREAQRRGALRAAVLEINGSITFLGEVAQQVAPLSQTSPSTELTLPAVILIKAPGRCRLELAPAGLPNANRPIVSVQDGQIKGQHGLEAIPAARALIEGLCTLLGETGGNTIEAERAIARRLSSHGISIRDVAFGHVHGRVAWVLGGRPQDRRPQAWIDKQTFQPIRLIASLAGAHRDLRLLDFGIVPGNEAFPHTVELWNSAQPAQLEVRFSTSKIMHDSRLPDALF